MNHMDSQSSELQKVIDSTCIKREDTIHKQVVNELETAEQNITESLLELYSVLFWDY